jgi:hypothetical protein
MTFQKQSFKKKSTGISGIRNGIGILLLMGVPEIRTKNWNSQPSYQAAATEVRCCYLAALFFHGLSNKAHRDLKKKVHNNALMGSNTVPCTDDKVLRLTDQYKSSYQQRQPGGGGGISKAAMAGAAATAAPSEKKPPHPVPAGEKDDKEKMLANSLGKRNCFNCDGDDHWVINCPDLTAVQCKELAGMAHVSIGDEEFEGISFLQNKSLSLTLLQHVRPWNHVGSI